MPSNWKIKQMVKFTKRRSVGWRADCLACTATPQLVDARTKAQAVEMMRPHFQDRHPDMK